MTPLFSIILLAAANAVAAPQGLVPAAKGTLSPAVQAQIQKGLQSFQYTQKTPLAASVPWLTHTFAALFLILAVSLVLLLAVQTTKQEGLSGTIGGRVESAYRPRLGFDQQLARLTSYVAIGMVFFAVVLSITGI